MSNEIIMKIQEFIHPVVLKLFTMKTKGKMIIDGKFPLNGTFLIVANHQCIQDIPQLGQVIGEHFYLLVSDEDKYTIDGLGLTLNGVKWVHRTDKVSRQESGKDIVKILNSGKHFAMYPEATWNLSPNLLMLPMNYGCIRTALISGVPIIPVVTLFSENERHTKIGEIFYPTEDLEKSIDMLRDTMASMFYEEIFEYYERNWAKDSRIHLYIDAFNDEISYYEKRTELSDDYWENYVSYLYDQYGRAKKDKSGVREFESQFIFTPKEDGYSYFQIFNSIIRDTEDGIRIKRISSEKSGYEGTTYDDSDYKEYFGFGYNEHILKRQLKK